jgi:hypothetical protein
MGDGPRLGARSTMDWQRHSTGLPGHNGSHTGARPPPGLWHESSPMGAQTHLGPHRSSVVMWWPGDGDEVAVAMKWQWQWGSPPFSGKLVRGVSGHRVNGGGIGRR